MSSYFEKVKLNTKTIKKFKLVEDNNRVEVPYLDEDGKPKMLYNIWKIGDFKKYIIICSDEIDCLTLLQLGIRAVACPEEETFKMKWSSLFKDIPKIFTFFKNSPKADVCREKVRNSFGSRVVYDIKLPNIKGVNSINDLYVREEYNADDFKSIIVEAEKKQSILACTEDEEEPDAELKSGFVDGSTIGELVLPVPGKEAYFLVYDLKSNKIVERKEYKCSGKTFLPLKVDKLLLDNVVNIPTGMKEYKDTEYLIGRIGQLIDKYADIPGEFGKEAAIAYILLTWVYDRFSSIPYLRFLGDYGTGKSRVLKVLNICYKSINVGNLSHASMFRIIDQYQGTLIIDEAELVGRSEQNINIKNALRHGKDVGSITVRCEGDNNKPRSFKIFCPKILGSRMSYGDDALESRILTIRMKETKRDNIPLQLDIAEFKSDCENIRSMLLRWRLENYFKIDIDFYQKHRINGMSKRLNEIIAPLICIRGYDSGFVDLVAKYVERKQNQLDQDRYMSPEAAILAIAYNNAGTDKGYILLKKMQEEMYFNYGINISTRGIGYLVRDLNLETKHTYSGGSLIIDKNNIVRIIKEMKLEKIITEADGDIPKFLKGKIKNNNK